MKTKIASPSPRALIQSMRNLGYDLASALADVIDNSISAKGKNIMVDYSWNDGSPFILIQDDGIGMDAAKLFEAMTPGATSPLQERELDDLGRFGLGLKTASWSQCKRVTVFTKKDNSVNHLTWDLNHVDEVDEWELIEALETEEKEILKGRLETNNSGTVVLWTDLDRVISEIGTEQEKEMHFYATMAELVIPHLSMVFHRYLERASSLKLKVGLTECKPWDPFMSKHHATQEVAAEKYSDERILITPYILPHSSKLTTALEKSEAEGSRGWDANQGFFVYRRGRMIISGGYFDLEVKPNQAHRLCRIKVDLTNEFDLQWKVDVRKKEVIPPPAYRNELTRIAKNTMDKSSKRYVARTRSSVKLRKNQKLEDVWLRKPIGEKIQYKINLESPGIKALMEQYNIEKSVAKQLFFLIERTLPYRSITLDNNEMEDATDLSSDEQIRPPSGLLDAAIKLVNYRINLSMSPMEAIDLVTQEIFPSFGAEFRITLEQAFGV